MQGKLSLGVKAHRAGGFPRVCRENAAICSTRGSRFGSPCVCGENLHHIHIWVICIMERREAYQ